MARYDHCRKHIQSLCCSMDKPIRIEYWKHRQGAAYLPDHKIVIPKTRGPVSYFIALHEVGHFVDYFNRGFTDFLNQNILDCETFAWQWAIENSLIKITQPMRNKMMEGLNSYHYRYYDESCKPSSSIYYRYLKGKI